MHEHGRLPRGLTQIPCMRREMERWDRQRRATRRARWFAAGCVLLMVGIVWLAIVRPATVQLSGGGILLAAGFGIAEHAAKAKW